MRTHKHILSLTYTLFCFFKSIYASLNFHMCLQNMTPPKFLWVLCCVRYDEIVSFFFLFFFVIFFFQFLLHYFSCLSFFFYLQSFFVFSLKKETKYNNNKKRNSCFFLFVFFVGCKFLLIKGDGQLDRHTDKQTSWLIINTNYRCEKEVKYFLLHCTHGQKVTTAVCLFFCFVFTFF